jgi:hypothetical protein
MLGIAVSAIGFHNSPFFNLYQKTHKNKEGLYL